MDWICLICEKPVDIDPGSSGSLKPARWPCVAGGTVNISFGWFSRFDDMNGIAGRCVDHQAVICDDCYERKRHLTRPVVACDTTEWDVLPLDYREQRGRGADGKDDGKDDGNNRAGDGMLGSGKRLGEGRPDAVLDIYDTIDDLLLAGRFDECDRLLGAAEPDGCPADILLGLLTVTLPASSKLPQRGKLMGLVRKALRVRGLDAGELLAGLEGECPDAVRAGGGVICQACGRAYYDHPQHGGFPFLNVLCDGTAVKL